MDHPLLIQSYFQEEIEVPRGNFGCLPVESNWLLEASPHIGLRQNYNQTTVFLASPRPCWRNADKRISLAAIVFVACFHPTWLPGMEKIGEHASTARRKCQTAAGNSFE
jgi:hypothetical protein